MVVKVGVQEGGPVVIQGGAGGAHAVLRLKCFRRIEIPQNFTVDGRIGAQMPIHRSGKDTTRHHRDSLRLPMRTRTLGPGTGGAPRLRVPRPRAGFGIERAPAATRLPRLRPRTPQCGTITAAINPAAPRAPPSRHT